VENCACRADQVDDLPLILVNMVHWFSLCDYHLHPDHAAVSSPHKLCALVIGEGT
jgi:hypothetical protein